MTPACNKRGPIAASYDELQSIDVLVRAWGAWPGPVRSRASTLRTVLQSVELVLHSLADLTTRAAGDLDDGNPGAASVKSAWCAAFHRLTTALSFVGNQAGIEFAGTNLRRVEFENSPGLAAYVESLRVFDGSLSRLMDADPEAIRRAMAEASTDDDVVRLLHNVSIASHEGTTWERTLLALTLPFEFADYGAFVDSDALRTATSEIQLDGDTYFQQFRCLHQVPELLSFEANAHLEAGIVAVREGAFGRAFYHLAATNDLVWGIVAALSVLVEWLVLADYHKIRENLGVTSGSHSVSLRYHLGRDLYSQLAEALTAAVARASSTADATAANCAKPSGDPTLVALLRESLRLRFLLTQWRQWHLHLPRSNLGASSTRSLTGSSDAVHTAAMMRDEAMREDGLTALARSFGLTVQGAPRGVLAARNDDALSVDRRILKIKSDITKARFPDVQNRSGHFSSAARFAPPVRRRAE